MLYYKDQRDTIKKKISLKETDQKYVALCLKPPSWYHRVDHLLNLYRHVIILNTLAIYRIIIIILDGMFQVNPTL